MSALFEDASPADLERLVAEFPLAWIIPHAAPAEARLMPILMETDTAGAPASLLGHLPLKAAITEAIGRNPAATCVFLGPHAYIPPGWITKPGWAPTWNFVSLKATGILSLDPALTEPAVRQLVAHMERRARSGWTVDQIGPRYQGLLQGIIGFRMRIDTLTPRFKTGQDETDRSFEEIRMALSGHPLSEWMLPRVAGQS